MVEDEREIGRVKEPEDAQSQVPNDGASPIAVKRQEGIVLPEDLGFDGLIQLLSQKPTQALSRKEYLADMEKRQTAVERHLLQGGADTLRRFFERLKEVEREQEEPRTLNLSMLTFSEKLLTGLRLPGANLEKLIVTDSDLGASDLTGANLRQAVGPRSKWRGAVLTGADLTDAVFPRADFSSVRAIGVDFSNTHLTDIIVDEQTNFAGSIFIGTYFGNTNLDAPNFAGAIFRGIRHD